MGRASSGLVAARFLPACASSTQTPLPDVRFGHGVASGDPLADAVILWTRVSPLLDTAPDTIAVLWEISEDPEFGELVASGDATASNARDYTLKVDVRTLAPATTYYYRFHALDETSPVGRTRTAPIGDHDRLRFGLVSCSCLSQGWFHAYRSLAERADLDAVIHVGDYIYEFGNGEYGNVRGFEPGHELVSLDDYRKRYAQYRRDADLQEVHRQHPFITTWDDHETANDSWQSGALNHMPNEGDWDARKADASQAYREWMPFREESDAGAPLKLWRGLRYGNLVDVFVLDTRIWGRMPPLNQGDEHLNDESRQLLGADQEAWLLDALRDSTATWKIIAQQIVFVQFPEIWNQFGWDGYSPARDRLLSRLRESGITGTAILSGDFHSSWANDVTEDPWNASAYNPSTHEGALAVEIVTPGVTSPLFARPDAEALSASVASDDPHIKWTDFWNRGYVVLDVTRERLQAAWFHIDDVTSPTSAEHFAKAFSTAPVALGMDEDSEPAAPRSDAPRLAP